MTFLDFLLIIAYGYLMLKLGWHAREAYAKHTMEKLFSQMEEDEQDEDVVRIYFEKEQGLVFAYNYDTNEFIAQGKDRESLLTAMVTRYPNTKFIVEKDLLETLS